MLNGPPRNGPRGIVLHKISTSTANLYTLSRVTSKWPFRVPRLSRKLIMHITCSLVDDVSITSQVYLRLKDTVQGYTLNKVVEIEDEIFKIENKT